MRGRGTVPQPKFGRIRVFSGESARSAAHLVDVSNRHGDTVGDQTTRSIPLVAIRAPAETERHSSMRQARHRDNG